MFGTLMSWLEVARRDGVHVFPNQHERCVQIMSNWEPEEVDVVVCGR